MSGPKGGAACFQCRRHKVRCNNAKPVCYRCQRLHKECEYPAAKTRDKTGSELEARALELELLVTKLVVSPLHDLSLASARLLDQVGRIGARSRQQPAFPIWLPVYPHFENLTPSLRASTHIGQPLLGPQVTEGFSPLIHRSVVEHVLGSCELEGEDEDLPLIASQYLISLFLPHRGRFHFITDVPHFLRSLSLPPSHPESIHPCLRYACYFAACSMTGGRLGLLQPYMLARARHFLDKSLMFADRLTHFLWASMILASDLVARKRRLEEGFAIISSAARLAYACGLARNPATEANHDYLLPPPKDKAEAEERSRLTRSIYLTDQVLATVSGFRPTFAYDAQNQQVNAKKKASETQQSVLGLRMSTLNVFERVVNFAHSVCANESDTHGHDYTSLDEQIASLESSVPRLSDDLQTSARFLAVTTSRPHIFFAHVTLYGSGMVLHSLQASKIPEARRELLRNLQSLVNICEEFRGPRRQVRVQTALASMRHIMNAIRVLVHELRAPEAKENIRLSIYYCDTIEFLLDFLDDMTMSYSAWADAPTTLADAIIPAVNALTP
ncbi:hypothetical protein DL93DRAFT_515639 [Clavulina sp. PMI_390]|nr:hypothetical protein DL93DRAFT_515639 [Clavulina sp. PMI_390]